MERFKYNTYSDYENIQKAGYEQKKNLIWANKKNIKSICDNILRDKYIVNEDGCGICHGVRTGKEIEWFLEYLPGWKVIGTEIADNINQNIYKWDFNKKNHAWIEKFDFIYTNAFDHAFNPEETIMVWIEQLKRNGILIIDHSAGHENATELDPFGATADDIETIMAVYGKLQNIKRYKMPRTGKYKYQYAITGVK